MWLSFGILVSLFCVNASCDPYVCTFDQNTCGWSNDPNNWRYSWIVKEMLPVEFGTFAKTNRAMCLSASAFGPKFFTKQTSSLTSLGPVARVSTNRPVTRKTHSIQARLWSPYLMASDGFRCITLQYYATFGDHFDPSPSEDGISLALLQRGEGSCMGSSQPSLGREFAVVCRNTLLWTSPSVEIDKRLAHSGWHYTQVDLSHEASGADYKLILEGTIPAGYPDARICVDNITSYTEPCSAVQKSSATVSNQWSWAQYFGVTFASALVLGLTIPILFLVVLVWACRRRHHTIHSPYTDNKLFSTNLWYYIGGKDICDDPTGFRGSASLVRSNKQHILPSATGTLLNGTSQPGSDVMDLPDVVIPGGRVVSFSYSGNTLGPGSAVPHVPQVNSPSAQPANCFATGFGNVDTMPSHNTGTTTVTPLRPGNSGQPPVIMTQSVAPNFGADAVHSQFPDPVNAQYNTYAPTTASTQQTQALAPTSFALQPPVVSTAVQQQPQQLQTPLPPQSQQRMVQQSTQPQISSIQHHQPQALVPQNMFQAQSAQCPQSPVSQVSLPHVQPHPQHQRRSIVQPVQSPPPQPIQSSTQHHSFVPHSPSAAQPTSPQPRMQTPVSITPVSPQSQSPLNVQPQSMVQATAQQQVIPSQLVAAVTPTARGQPAPVGRAQTDSLTEVEQQAAMDALFAATGQLESPSGTFVHATISECSPETRNDSYMDLNQAALREDHPPPGYDEAIGLVMARPTQNSYSVPMCNNGNLNNNHGHNTMAKPALPVPAATTPVPALPPRRIVNGMSFDDLEGSQSNTCLSLAERYGLPVAEI